MSEKEKELVYHALERLNNMQYDYTTLTDIEVLQRQMEHVIFILKEELKQHGETNERIKELTEKVLEIANKNKQSEV